MLHYCVIITLFDTDLHKSALSTYSFKKHTFCSAFEFDAILKDFYNICVIIIYITCALLFCLH